MTGTTAWFVSVDSGVRDCRRDDAHLLEVVPAHLELLGLGHVGHRAAGGEIRQDHLLVRRAQDVGALGHEMHAAEDDELGVGVLADLAGELERVAGVVGELDHLVALVVMAEDDEATAELGLRRGDAAVHLLVGETEVFLGQRLALGDVLFLVRRQNRNEFGHLLFKTRRAALSGPPNRRPERPALQDSILGDLRVEEVAHRLADVDAPDGLGEERRDRQDFHVRQPLVGRHRHRVGRDDLVDVGLRAAAARWPSR